MIACQVVPAARPKGVPQAKHFAIIEGLVQPRNPRGWRPQRQRSS
jgi:hypothetical protein